MTDDCCLIGFGFVFVFKQIEIYSCGVKERLDLLMISSRRRDQIGDLKCKSCYKFQPFVDPRPMTMSL
jgi:hypothetical protein